MLTRWHWSLGRSCTTGVASASAPIASILIWRLVRQLLVLRNQASFLLRDIEHG